MLRKTTISLFTLITLTTVILIACDDMIGPDCGTFTEAKFTVTDFNTAIYKQNYNDSSSTFSAEESGSDSLLYTDFVIGMETVPEYISSVQKKEKPIGFGYLAYACPPAKISSDDVIENIEIYSDNDFNSDYKAGENLADLFEIVAFYHHDGMLKLDLNDFLSEDRNAADHLFLVLKAAGEPRSEHHFTVKYHQKGEALNYYEYTTRAITLQTE